MFLLFYKEALTLYVTPILGNDILLYIGTSELLDPGRVEMVVDLWFRPLLFSKNHE